MELIAKEPGNTSSDVYIDHGLTLYGLILHSVTSKTF